MLAVPLVGISTVARTFTSVVLPAPFGPSRPCTSPCWMSSDTPSNAVMVLFVPRTLNSRRRFTVRTVPIAETVPIRVTRCASI